MKRSRNLLLFTIGLTGMVCALLAINLYFVSIAGIHLNSQTNLAEYSSNVNTVKQTLIAKRGLIIDRNGEIIAQDRETYTVYAIVSSTRPSYKNKPAYVVDKEATAKILADVLAAPYDYILERLVSASYQTEFGLYGSNLSLSQKNAIAELDLNGIGFTKTLTRHYPLNTFAAYLIGFVQKDELSTKGVMGIEAAYDKALAGVDGSKVAVVDRYGYSLPGYPEEVVNPQDGYNLKLTLDRSIQEQLESSFLMTQERFNATEAWGAVMEVDTGKILAVGQYPSYDPNKKDITNYQSYLTQQIYEPGSTMKAFTYAAAIDSGVYHGSDTFNSATFLVGLDKNGNAIRSSNSGNLIGSIRNANNRDWGQISYDLGFAYSSNVGIASLLTKYLDDDVFMEYLVRFGFKNKVNLDGMNETIGSINYTWPLDKLTVGYGQGISLNMAQILQAYTAIFNEGKLVKPYVLDEIFNAKTKEVIQKTDVQVIGQAIQAETASKVQSLMYDVVYGERGTGQYYKVDEVSILAKTGTAQMIIDGEYSKDQYIYSVVIGLPADKPEVMVYYAFKAPVNNMAHVDTNPIKQLLRQIALVNDYREAVDAQLTQEKEASLTSIPFKNYINHSLDYAYRDLLSMEDRIIILGDGDRIIDQYPKDVEHILSTQNIYFLTSYDNIVLPDLIGKSKKDIQAFVNLSGVNAIYSGEGNAVSMNIETGTIIDSTMTLEVVFE